MRKTMIIVGAVLMLFGTVWFLQGINVLPGSYMTGQIKWAAYGALAFGIGLLMLLGGRKIPPAAK